MAQDMDSKLEVAEGVASVWHYHLRRTGELRALCSAQVMHSSMPLARWGKKIPDYHIPESFCATCDRARLTMNGPLHPAAAIFAAYQRGWRHPFGQSAPAADRGLCGVPMVLSTCVRATHVDGAHTNDPELAAALDRVGGAVQHEPPPCGHHPRVVDCIECVREDARRCAYWELAAKRQRDELREFIEATGRWREFDTWLAGRRTQAQET